MADASDWNCVWITGASSGIGLELARQLDGEVAHVAVSARSADKLRVLADQSRTVAAFPLNVSDEKSVADAVENIEDAHGPIDLAILNASLWRLMAVTELDLDAIRAALQVNSMGVVHAVAALVPRMVARRAGHIAIVASVAGYRGLPSSIAYGPTKAALINLAEILRCELEPLGVTVSVVNSGFVDTPATRTNPFPMPALMTAPDAARRMIEGLARKHYEVIFPRRFVYATKLLRLLPNAVFFFVVRRFIWRQQPAKG